MDSILDMEKLDYRLAVDTMANDTAIRNCLADLHNLRYLLMERDPIIIVLCVDLITKHFYEKSMGDLKDFPSALSY